MTELKKKPGRAKKIPVIDQPDKERVRPIRAALDTLRALVQERIHRLREGKRALTDEEIGALRDVTQAVREACADGVIDRDERQHICTVLIMLARAFAPDPAVAKYADDLEAEGSGNADPGGLT